MSTQVVRVEGYSKGSLTNIGNECDRKPGVEHRNSDIDHERTYLNESYKDAKDGFYAEFHQLMSAMNCQEFKPKKGAIAFEGMIITADIDFFKELGYEPDKIDRPTKWVRYFFDEVYAWALSQIGYKGTDKNIISAKVHYDEKTPHIHIYYIPVVDKWREKVYAKDGDGKVLRNDKGSPLQAKDESGKAIFNYVDNSESPKISRSEFWRQKGGKTSYRMLQDDFYNKISVNYKLERGEIGSDRKHETKHQWKQRQLEAEIKPLEELKVEADSVGEKQKKLPFGKVLVDSKEYERTVEQAKAYQVNLREIENNRRDKERIAETEARQRKEQEELNKDRALAEQAYNRQINLNNILERTERELEGEKKKNAALTCENADLKKQSAKKDNAIGELESTRREAYKSLTNIVQAAGLLKYSENEYNAGNLTPKQGRLIDAIGNYGAKLAEKDGFPNLAKDMANIVYISGGIQKEIDKLASQRQSISHGAR